jgi:ribonuclease Y
MSTVIYCLVAFAIGVLTGIGLLLYYWKIVSHHKLVDAQNESENIIQQAEREVNAIKKEASIEARDIIFKAHSEAEKELKERRNELNQLDRRLHQRAEILDRRLEQIEKKETDYTKRDKDIRTREKKLIQNEKEIENLINEQTSVLQRLSGLSKEEAKNEFMKRVEDEARYEAARLSKKIEDESRQIADRKAKETISLAIQRYASDFVSDVTVTAITLPSDEMKGRIIGREGRNIRALESATGIELIIDDTPETIVLSSFDPVRREVAKLSLDRLISDGRINPARIEEIVEKIKKEVELNIREEGEKAVFDLGLHGIHYELVKLLGRLKFRASYAQNVLQHSREVAYLAGIMAGELGVDIKLAKRAGLLHDIGKAVDHEIEGSHQYIGAILAKKYGENSKIVNAIEVHHGEGEPLTVEAVLVAAADALSAARPGARKESLENYLKRLEDLEEIANSYEGIEKSYAIQAGREIRIIVRPDEVSEDICAQISRDLVKRIEDELTYPGQIKVTIIRETRYIGYAK